MPATTTALKITYPLPGDRLADYPAAAKAAAETIDAAIKTPTTTPLTVTTGWTLDNSAGRLTTIGAVHTAPITIKRNSGLGLTTTTGTEFSLLTIPVGVAVPTVDWTVLGSIHFGAYSCPLVYRSDARTICALPTAAFPVNANEWAYGLATWIA